MRSERMRYAIGRGSRVKYSTSMDWDEWRKKRRRYPVRYSIGEDSRIVHSTGKEFDKKVRLKLLEEEMKKSEEKFKKESHKKTPPKPFKKMTIDY